MPIHFLWLWMSELIIQNETIWLIADELLNPFKSMLKQCQGGDSRFEI